MFCFVCALVTNWLQASDTWAASGGSLVAVWCFVGVSLVAVWWQMWGRSVAVSWCMFCFVCALVADWLQASDT